MVYCKNICIKKNKSYENDDIQCKTPLCNSWLPLPTIVSTEPLLCEPPPLVWVICSGSDPNEASVTSTLYTDALCGDLELPLL